MLGGAFHFAADDARLLRLVDESWRGLRPQRLSADSPRFNIRLQLTSGSSLGAVREPPPLRTQGDGRFLCGVMDTANFAIVCPQLRAGLVSISRQLLRFPYHARYELLEFAVFTLASRAQGLVPLHAGCIGRDGSGLLLIGASGAGKSTLALHGMLQDLDVLAEDAVFIEPASLRATGVANFLHLRDEALRFVDSPALAARIRRSPVICRRSGVEKYEVDLRGRGWRIAPAPLRIAGIVFVSGRSAGKGALLAPLAPRLCRERLAASQPYAAGLPGWKAFDARLSGIGAFELKRASHPRESVAALCGLLERRQARRGIRSS